MKEKKQEGKTVIQSFANWLALKKGVESFNVTYSDTAFIVRRIDTPDKKKKLI